MKAVSKSVVRKSLQAVANGDILALSIIALVTYPIFAIGYRYLPKSMQNQAIGVGYYLLVTCYGRALAMKRKLRKHRGREKAQIEQR